MFLLKRKGFVKMFVIVFCLTTIFTSSFAFASTTLLTYNGTGIRDKASKNNFALANTTTITLKHKTTGVSYTGPNPVTDAVLTVNLQRKGTLFYSNTGDSITTTGIQNKSKTWTKSSGTYRLYFSTKALSETYWPGVTIEGTITK